MPKVPSDNSTIRRHKLAAFIDEFGNIMVKSCSTCQRHKRVCKVHLRSGKCSECLHHGQRCDVRVTQSEWDRLKADKARLRKEIKEAYEAQEAAHAAQEKAREDLWAAFAKEMRLQQQMDLLDKRAEEAIAVEEANIVELEQEELLDVSGVPEGSLGLNLALDTWSALDGLPLDFWEVPTDVFGGTAVATSGSS